MMKSKTKIFAIVTVAVVMLGILFVQIPEAKAQFVIAWDYDSEAGNGFTYDSYGQGFYMYHLRTNYSDPSWDLHPDHTETYYFNASSYTYEWDVGYGLGVRFYVWMNSTLTGASDLTDGQDYMMCNATITNSFGTELDNITDITPFYQSSFWDAEMWLYGFDAEFNVIGETGAVYTVTLTYQVYW